MKWLVRVVQEEIFKTIEVYDRELEVSNFGTIRCFDLRSRKKSKLWERRSDELPFNRGKNSYLHVNFGKKKVLAHLLVAKLFVEKPKDTDHEYVVWFIDRNRKNIKASNLIWITKEECHQRMSLEYAGNTKNNNGSKRVDFDDVRNIRSKYEEGTPVMELAREYKVSHTQIRRILTRENFTYI